MGQNGPPGSNLHVRQHCHLCWYLYSLLDLLSVAGILPSSKASSPFHLPLGRTVSVPFATKMPARLSGCARQCVMAVGHSWNWACASNLISAIVVPTGKTTGFVQSTHLSEKTTRVKSLLLQSLQDASSAGKKNYTYSIRRIYCDWDNTVTMQLIEKRHRL